MKVTILILIDGFLQQKNNIFSFCQTLCHNPYFNRWFSAILHHRSLILRECRHNPYFNRWFSAIRVTAGNSFKHICVTILILIDGFLQQEHILVVLYLKNGHNPYFNRWFSAIWIQDAPTRSNTKVTILILIDGFLQYDNLNEFLECIVSHNPYFNRWFSAIEKSSNVKSQ